MSDSPYQILLYYLYCPIEDPVAWRDGHRLLGARLDLRGRIIVAKEGINGTVSGTAEACEAYMNELKSDPVTADIWFKIDPADGHAFPKFSVKARDEIVSLHLGDEDFTPLEATGNYLAPKEWREHLGDPNTVVIDARNRYEWELGHFEGAVLPPVDSFRELPQWIRDHRDQFEGKKILTYCTGGIRCEKFSGFLKREGFEDVNQLHGGIWAYANDPEVKGDGFQGSCYVFDQRIKIPVNHTPSAKVISRCRVTNEPCERYVNCRNKRCNKKIFLSAAGEEIFGRFCSAECKSLVEELVGGDEFVAMGGQSREAQEVSKQHG